MWRVGYSTMTRRAGLSFCGKDARMFILSDLVAPPLSWSSKIAGYAAKGFVLCCLLHISVNVELGVGRLWRGFARFSSVRSLLGLCGGGGLVGGLSGSGT